MVLTAVSNIEQFVDVFIEVYLLVIFLYVLTSWITLPYSLRPLQRFLVDLCDPYLRLWRRILPMSAGPLDFSPIAGIFALIFLRELINDLLNRLH
jgi:YggT family protein